MWKGLSGMSDYRFYTPWGWIEKQIIAYTQEKKQSEPFHKKIQNQSPSFFKDKKMTKPLKNNFSTYGPK